MDVGVGTTPLAMSRAVCLMECGLIDIEQDNLLFISLATGELAAHTPVTGVEFGKDQPGGMWAKITKTHKEPDPDNPRKSIDVSEDWLRCDIKLESNIRRRCLKFSFELKPDPSVFAKKWRK